METFLPAGTNEVPDKSKFLIDYKIYLVNGDGETAHLVTAMGGELVDSPGPGVISLVDSKDSKGGGIPNLYNTEWLREIWKEGKIIDLAGFKAKRVIKAKDVKINLAQATDSADKATNNLPDINISNGINILPSITSFDKSTDKIPTISTGRKSNKFKPEEDELILDLVRRNPNLRSTHSFFERIAKLEPLSHHTGNSIRYRYRKILAKQLTYVYQLDPFTNEVIIDSKTKEPVKITEIPSLIKSQYTAQEDYMLCKQILTYFSKDNGKKKLVAELRGMGSVPKNEISLDPKSQISDDFESTEILGSVPESVFHELAKEYPTHSAMSWRDRYRKFAKKYGLKKYVKYYEDCQATGQTPWPMKNLSSRTERETKTLQIKEERKRIISQSAPRMAADEERQIVRDSDLQAMALAATAARNMSSVIDSSALKDTVDSPQLSPSNIDDKLDMKEKSNIFASDSSQGLKEYDLHDSDNNNTVESSTNQDNNNEVLDNNAQADDAADDDLKPDDGLMDFKQLIDIDPEPLKNREMTVSSTDVLLDLQSKVHACFSRFTDGSPYDLFKDISDLTGISMLWLNYWFDCSCGMLMTFQDAVLNYLSSGGLIMDGHPGFWTETDDELLKKDPDNGDLLKLHGKESLEKRKAVLFRYG